jgi:hypothetical protein
MADAATPCRPARLGVHYKVGPEEKSFEFSAARPIRVGERPAHPVRGLEIFSPGMGMFRTWCDINWNHQAGR